MRSILLIICFALFLVACDDGGSSEPILYPEQSLAKSSSSDLPESSNVRYSCDKSSSSSSYSEPISSSSVESSSSDVKSCSSVMIVPCKTETEDKCEYGILVDERDEQTYKTVKIGEQIWMAENLNYAYLQPTAQLDSSSWCYDNDPVNCEKYGRLYLWSAAVDSAALFSESGKGFGFGHDCGNLQQPKPCGPEVDTRGACPAGWRLPWLYEWHGLYRITGNSNHFLKSRYGWADGIDSYGFGGLPSGFANIYQESVVFYQIGEITDFWTPTTEDGAASPSEFALEDDFYLSGYNFAFPIRCVRDE